MKISEAGHLSYCTNIHPGESWKEVFESLQYTLAVKKAIADQVPFGIGLRLSAQAARDLGLGRDFQAFQEWLKAQQCYVFTMNGFPYGGFHRTIVKDQVHAPDWTTVERVEYTRLLFDQLALLLPDDISEGGISTSPLSYRFWHKSEKDLEAAILKSCSNLIFIVAHLKRIHQETGKLMHLDLEPEPDGILENSEEFIHFYEEVLLREGAKLLSKREGISQDTAEADIRRHIQLCYDVCHVAVAYETHDTVIQRFQEKAIQIGKIQISAAIKAQLNKDNRAIIQKSLSPFNESTYLHQTVFRKKDHSLVKYPDLEPALEAMKQPEFEELRTHFHVPIFTEGYGALSSTQEDISEVLRIWKQKPFSQHLEVETYTWEVLPETLQAPLTESISRELQWVLDKIT